MKIIDFLRKLLEVLWSVPTRLFGSRNERLLKHYSGAVAQINALEPEIAKLSDAALAAKTGELKKRYSEGATLEQLLPEAFAVVREASKRTLRMRHFDVQLVGGMVLNDGKIAEMKTGEGKTLAATLPAYLNALTGAGVHIVTVNDYLASRDADWMGKIYRFLGLSVGVNLPHMEPADKRKAYAADITYGTNNEFGFDYLRDNMAMHVDERFQRGLHYAIVDEVDSILIDEARTPLIISGQAEDRTEIYYRMNEVAPLLTRQKEENAPGDFWVDEKNHQILLSESGHQKAEEILARIGMLPQGASLYEPAYINLVHQLYAALRAHHLFHRDQHYVVQDDQVIIVDEFTGRLMQGRRWSDGLHQAVEAKENVKIERENQTLATITLQNYFRMYDKLSGMTGTAETEASEFHSTYKLEVIVIPTHMPMVRKDNPDVIYRTLPEKWDAVVEEIKERYEHGQPALVGTVSVENSELISRRLQREAVPHNVLNAKYHEREAEIVAQAGRKGAVTIATNMAGRGTDILLGGNPDFMAREFLKKEEVDPEEANEEQWNQAFAQAKRIVEEEHEEVVGIGGLHILGTERHESRRIDNQLRGRAGRQGDPGSSRFFLSLEDDLMRIFAGDKVKALMQRLGMDQGVAIESRMVSKRIESAQKSVEGRNFESRKHLLEYDDVMNKQRETIYGLRRQLMEQPDQREYLIGETGVARDLLADITAKYLNPDVAPDDWDIENYKVQLHTIYALDSDIEAIDFKSSASEEIADLLWEKLKAKYAEKEK